VVPAGGLDVLKKSFLHLPGKEPLSFSCLAGELNTVRVTSLISLRIVNPYES
jgi:hypothetical protein